MTETQCIELIVTLIGAIPTFASAIEKLVEGHPDAQSVRDILAEKSASQTELESLQGTAS